MKIILNGPQDVEEFVSMLSPAYIGLIHATQANCDKLRGQVQTQQDVRYEVCIASESGAPLSAEALTGLSQAIREAARTGVTDIVRERENTPPAEPTVDSPLPGFPPETAQPVLDVTGRGWDERIDSSNKALTDKGLWRARRNVPAELREQVLAEWETTRGVQEARAELTHDMDISDEPVVTETHALPQDEPADAAEPAAEPTAPESLPSVDMAALVETCRGELEGNASDSAIELLNTARDFIGQHGTAVMEAIKAAAVPDEAGKGKAIPLLAPGERRLLRACLDNYGL